jgi:hypothetical protein
MFPLLVDQAKNIIIYCSEDTLMVENYTNEKSLSFKDKRLVGPLWCTPLLGPTVVVYSF